MSTEVLRELVGALGTLAAVLVLARAGWRRAQREDEIRQLRDGLRDQALRDAMHVETAPRPPRCTHVDAVPVESIVDGTLVAHWCPSCSTQLPPTWRPRHHAPTVGELNAAAGVQMLRSFGVSMSRPATPADCVDCKWVEEQRLCDPEPTWHLARPCAAHHGARS